MAIIAFVACEIGTYPATSAMADELECPLWRKVKMSLCASARHDDQPRSERLIRLQDQIGAGESHPFGFSFETLR